jgi:protein gp37
MSGRSKIQWTDRTWNPVRGCSRVSAGCERCYAERLAYRFNGPAQPYEGLTRMTRYGPVWTGKLRLVPEVLQEPLRWRKPCRVFVNSMSDLFHEAVPQEFIDRVFSVMAEARLHIFQILTKRPGRMLEIARRHAPLSNVWLGVSVENQAMADERIPLLLDTPAAVRFLSVEPLLGPVNIFRRNGCVPIGWVIVGGESGPGARPCDVEWIRDLVCQCRGADVPAFVKQLGTQPLGLEYCLRDHKGGNPAEWPEHLRVREYPGEDRAEVA